MKQIRIFLLIFGLIATVTAQTGNRLNILLITVDDMSCDSIGAFGCKVPDTTPNIDRLASEGLRFEYAHVQVGNCMPSRNVMQSGRYPHNNGVEGFYQVKNPDYPILPDLMKEHGYFIGIKGKVSHTTPYTPYDWDIVLEPESKKDQRNKESFYRLTKQGIATADAAGKPFYLIMNITDPHKPFYGMDKHQNLIDDPLKPSKIFTENDIVVPGFLPDTPAIRKEVAHYYSSVRRADDCVGAILQALHESSHERNTVVMFLSDHGMPLPFAKTTVYHHGTRTPWIVRWPGVTRPGSIDSEHMISAVDLAPTILEIVGIPNPGGMDGRSFAPLLRGEKQSGRDMIFKEYNENSGGFRHPMRCVQTKNFCYIFNPWSDGTNVFKTATTGTIAYREMQRLAKTDPNVAARLELFNHRVPEELYDIRKDPDSLRNLINSPEYQKELNRLRKALEDWMEQTGDHMLPVMRHREDRSVAAAYMRRVQQEADKRRKMRVKKKRRKPAQKKARQGNFLTLQAPKQLTAGTTANVTITHKIPTELGKQYIYVTLKANQKQRIERKVLSARGDGTLKVSFNIPTELAGKKVSFAVFIGKDYPSCLQHIATKAIPVK